jgi:hypothetical protein
MQMLLLFPNSSKKALVRADCIIVDFKIRKVDYDALYSHLRKESRCPKKNCKRKKTNERLLELVPFLIELG